MFEFGKHIFEIRELDFQNIEINLGFETKYGNNFRRIKQ